MAFTNSAFRIDSGGNAAPQAQESSTSGDFSKINTGIQAAGLLQNLLNPKKPEAPNPIANTSLARRYDSLNNNGLSDLRNQIDSLATIQNSQTRAQLQLPLLSQYYQQAVTKGLYG